MTSPPKTDTAISGATANRATQDRDGRAATLLIAACGTKGMRVYNLLLLFTAIVLEICGDASIRVALRSSKPLLFLFGSALLICYGTLVSFPSWTFSKTMGVYIAIFFIVSQIVASTILGEHIKLPAIVGGTLIVSGGMVILFWKTT